MRIIGLSLMLAALLLGAAECKTNPGTGDRNPRPSCGVDAAGNKECPLQTGKG